MMICTQDVDWGELDYLIVDAPPGTSDEHISVAQVCLSGFKSAQDLTRDTVLSQTTPPCKYCTTYVGPLGSYFSFLSMISL